MARIRKLVLIFGLWGALGANGQAFEGQWSRCLDLSTWIQSPVQARESPRQRNLRRWLSNEASRLPDGWMADPVLTRIGDLQGPHRRALFFLWLGRPGVALECLAGDSTWVGRALLAQSYAELGEFTQARSWLQVLEDHPPARAFAAFLRSSMADWEGDADLESRWLEEARNLVPESIEIRATLASRFATRGESKPVDQFLEWDAQQPGAEGPVRQLSRAGLLAALGRLEPARKLLVSARSAAPRSPQISVVQAGIELRAGNVPKALEALKEVVELARGSLILIPTANLLATLGHGDLAQTALSSLQPSLRYSPKVRQLLAMLDARHETPKTLSWGPFRLDYDNSTPESVLARVRDSFDRARAIVDRNLGAPGPEPVELSLVFSPGDPPWGYYDSIRRKIVCRGDFRPGHQDPSEALVLEHMIRHEYAHLAFDAYLRGGQDALISYPRWLMEGIADQLAGGIDYLSHFSFDVARLPREPRSTEHLSRVLSSPILGFGTLKESDQVQAYFQSYQMVDVLLERIGPRQTYRRLAAFLRRLSQGRDVAEELKRQFGAGVETLTAGYPKALEEFLQRPPKSP